MKVTLPFKGTKTEGIARVKQVLEQEKKKIEENAQNVQADWKDNVLHFSFSAQGQDISGTLTVGDGVYDLYAKLPFMLSLFEGKIEKMIEQEVAKMRL